jgi:hypothetical protein
MKACYSYTACASLQKNMEGEKYFAAISLERHRFE